jgi:hypothetical protein
VVVVAVVLVVVNRHGGVVPALVVDHDGCIVTKHGANGVGRREVDAELVLELVDRDLRPVELGHLLLDHRHQPGHLASRIDEHVEHAQRRHPHAQPELVHPLRRLLPLTAATAADR